MSDTVNLYTKVVYMAAFNICEILKE